MLSIIQLRDSETDADKNAQILTPVEIQKKKLPVALILGGIGLLLLLWSWRNEK